MSLWNFEGGKIICACGDACVIRKRGREVINSVQRNSESIGIVGSDRLDECGSQLKREVIEPIVNERAQILRFALIALQSDRVKSKLSYGEPLKLLTSYPNTAKDLLGGLAGQVVYVSGGIEAELIDRSNEDLDGAIELVQSGASVRANNLTIVEDYLRQVNLIKVWS